MVFGGDNSNNTKIKPAAACLRLSPAPLAGGEMCVRWTMRNDKLVEKKRDEGKIINKNYKQTAWKLEMLIHDVCLHQMAHVIAIIFVSSFVYPCALVPSLLPPNICDRMAWWGLQDVETQSLLLSDD